MLQNPTMMSLADTMHAKESADIIFITNNIKYD